MRATVFRGSDRLLSVETVPDPKPGANEVLLKVCRCGVCGTDLHRSERNFATFREGTIPGHEFSGEVVEVGKGVEGLKVGDLVTALPYLGCNACLACLRGYPVHCEKTANLGSDVPGAFAEYVVTGAPFTLKLPGGLTPDDGALVEPLAVAVRAVIRAGVRPGSRVLILGAGPIGLGIAYWARRAGASQVAVQARSRRRADYARQMGADVFVSTVDGEAPHDTARAAMAEAPEIVFECVGLPGSIDQAIATVAPQGKVVVVGACMEPDHWLPVRGLTKEIDIRFSMVYDRAEFQTAIDALDSGAVEPRTMVSDIVGLDALPAAIQALRDGADQCKVMVDPRV
ncbi:MULTISPECIES: alcohol dehydrogenase catalytic domain-containing protein [unclassified Phenylobacterium]|uniref:alcohol dehydrogenase catalytic domain-containing protein n=1 Tax=unclassified Phenylobacterium TaxID=2640670 RepID=UPI00083B2B82|nr:MULTISPECIES: alcohol dehydrogenase catalytic domain-containing protein [unclassified Phenylobacterium]